MDAVLALTAVRAVIRTVAKIARTGDDTSVLAEVSDHAADLLDARLQAAEKADEDVVENHKRELQADTKSQSESHKAFLQYTVERELLRYQRDTQDSPLSLEDQEARHLVLDDRADAQGPVLLVAPFHNDQASIAQNDGGLPGYLTGITQAWFRGPWSGDTRLINGLISRPLRRGAVDVARIRSVLADQPVFLLHGVIEEERRVWVTINAWNFLSTAASGPAPRFELHLGPFLTPLPPSGALTHSSSLAFNDEIGRFCTMLVGVLTEWHRLMATGTAPRVGQTRAFAESIGMSELPVGLCLAGAYEVAQQLGVLQPVQALAGRARMLLLDDERVLGEDLTETLLQRLHSDPPSTRAGRCEAIGALRQLKDLAPLTLVARVRELLERFANIELASAPYPLP